MEISQDQSHTIWFTKHCQVWSLSIFQKNFWASPFIKENKIRKPHLCFVHEVCIKVPSQNEGSRTFPITHLGILSHQWLMSFIPLCLPSCMSLYGLKMEIFSWNPWSHNSVAFQLDDSCPRIFLWTHYEVPFFSSLLFNYLVFFSTSIDLKNEK